MLKMNIQKSTIKFDHDEFMYSTKTSRDYLMVTYKQAIQILPKLD